MNSFNVKFILYSFVQIKFNGYIVYCLFLGEVCINWGTGTKGGAFRDRLWVFETSIGYLCGESFNNTGRE